MKIKHALCCLPLAYFFHTSSYAHSLYLGYSQTEQEALVASDTISYRPEGLLASASFDLSDNWSINLDYSQLEDEVSSSTFNQNELDVKSWSIGSNWYWHDWSFSFNYAKWEDVSTSHRRDRSRQIRQQTDAPSYSFTLAHDWYLDQWSVGLHTSLQRTDWTFSSGFVQSSEFLIDNSDQSNFLSAGLSVARLIEWQGGTNLMLGVTGTRHEALSGSSASADDNAVNDRRVPNRRRGRISNIANAIGNESYSDISMYAVFEITPEFTLDVSTSFEIGGEEAQSFSFGVGYEF